MLSKEHTRNTLIDTQIKIKELEKGLCRHYVLNSHNGTVWQCKDCNELFYIESCPF